MEKLPEKLIGKTILVVEDDPISSEFLSEVFSNSGVKLIFSSSGEEAISQVDSGNSIDLVLMDIRLPGINGYKATRELKRLNPEIPIIAQTAYALEGDREKALDSGCDEYISKPIRTAELYEAIDKVLS